MGESVRLADVLGGLSTVADLGYGLPPEEAMRSCLVATALARAAGLDDGQVAAVFYTALLRHIGCVGFSHEMAGFFGDDIQANRAGARTNFADPRDIFRTLIPETTRGMNVSASLKAATTIATRGPALGRRYETSSCEVARATARRLGLPDGVQHGLYQVFEWWNGRGAPRGLRADEIHPAARVARVAGDAVLFHRLGGTEVAVEALRRRAGSILDPRIVDMFTSRVDGFLHEATGDPRERLLAVEPGPALEVDAAGLPDMADAFGDLADLKTPFMHGHSKEVARLAGGAGTSLGLDADTLARVRVAAHLHDLGRVGIPNSVWEKQGALTSGEWEQVRMYPYHSERILATSHRLESLASVAGRHRERLDGTGYHRGCTAREIPVSARILACADAFQAMTQRRPHRIAMPPERAADELMAEVRAGRLDGDVAVAVLGVAGQPRRPTGRDDRPAGLSDREIEVLRLVADGYSNPQIAVRLGVSRRTAEHHVQHIYTKIGVASRAAAALFALEHELLPPGG